MGLPYEAVLLWALDDATGLYKPIGATLLSGSYALDVNIKGGGGSGGTSATDEDPFVAGTSKGTPIMGEDPTSGELLIVQLVAGSRVLQVGGSVTTTPLTSSSASSPSIVSVGTSSTLLIAANAAAKRRIIQNVGTTKLYVLRDATTGASSSNYHFILPAGGTSGDGSSPLYIDEMCLGAFCAASSAAGGACSVSEDL